MPFVTEEIWQALPDEKGKESIMIQPYPKGVKGWRQPQLEERVTYLTDVIRAIRNLRSETNVPPAKDVRVIIFDGDRNEKNGARTLEFLKSQEPYLCSLARVGTVEYSVSDSRPETAATAVVGTTEIFLPVPEDMNLQEEEVRLSKEIGKVEAELSRSQKKLDNKEFLAKAKAEVIEKEKKKAGEFGDKIRTLRTSLIRIQKLLGQRKS